MKITFILLLLVYQTSGSFFDDFQGALSSVEESFGKLLTDVVTDVKQAIDCTILAVEKALSLGGVFGEPSEYEKRCLGKDSTAAPNPTTERSSKVTNVPSSRFNRETSPQNNTDKENVEKNLSRPLTNINETLSETLEKKVNNTKKRLQNVKNVLINETNRLSEVNSLLQRELMILSKDVKQKLDMFKSNESELSVKDIWSELKTLNEVEKSDKNSTQIQEIRHVFNQVLDVLHIHNNSSGETDEDKIKEIISNLSKGSNKTATEIDNEVLPKKEKVILENINKTTTNELKTLNEVEKSDKNSTHAQEMNPVYNQSLDVLNIKNNASGKIDEDKIKDIILNLPKSSNETISEIDNVVLPKTKKPILENINNTTINELNTLNETEKCDKKNTHAQEISHVFNQSLDALNIHNKASGERVENKTKETMSGLSKSSNKTVTEIDNEILPKILKEEHIPENINNTKTNELETVNEVKKSDKNSAHAQEISNIFNQSLDILNVHNNASGKIDEDKTKEIISDLPKSSNETITEINNEVLPKTKKPILENINFTTTNELKALNKTENSDKNSTHVQEINNVYRQSSDLLNIQSNASVETGEDKIKKIISDLPKRSRSMDTIAELDNDVLQQQLEKPVSENINKTTNIDKNEKYDISDASGEIDEDKNKEIVSDLSKSSNKTFTEIDNEVIPRKEKPTLENVNNATINELKPLNEVEKSDKNSVQAQEISHVFNQNLDVLNIHNKVSAERDENKIKEIISGMSKNSNKTNTKIDNEDSQSQQKKPISENVNDTRNADENEDYEIADTSGETDEDKNKEFMSDLSENSNKTNLKIDKFSQPLQEKPVLENINKTRNVDEYEDYDTDTAEETAEDAAITTNEQSDEETIKSDEFADYPFYDIGKKGSKSHDEAIQQAKSIFDESKRTADILNNIFSNSASGSSAFDSDQWNFRRK